MPTKFDTIDPEWAWSPFEPTKQAPWDHERVTHLFRRTAFGASPRQVESALADGPEETIRRLFDVREPAEFQTEITSLIDAVLAGGNLKRLSATWLYRMVTSPCPLLEMMTLFWHGHFATSASKVQDARLMQEQNQLLREHALGDFRALVHEISRDPAMLIWLDSATNRKAHPNENYAREIMELFVLGEGEYTETDIRELARCFTGWEIRQNRFRFNRYQHDFGEKTLFGTTGKLTGEMAVDLILDHPAGPGFIIRKLIRFFLFDEPAPPHRLIQPLADQLREDRFHIAPVLRRMLSSRLFFSEFSRARMIRSPIHLAVGFLRSLTGMTNMNRLQSGVAEIGQEPFFPPNVKGWDGGRTWINSSTLLGRANLIRAILDDESTRFAGGGLSEMLHDLGVDQSKETVRWWESHLLARPLPEAVSQQISDRIGQETDSREQQLRDGLHLLCTQPEFQLA